MKIIEPKKEVPTVYFGALKNGDGFEWHGLPYIKIAEIRTSEFLRNAIDLTDGNPNFFNNATLVTPRPDLVLTTLDNCKEGK